MNGFEKNYDIGDTAANVIGENVIRGNVIEGFTVFNKFFFIFKFNEICRFLRELIRIFNIFIYKNSKTLLTIDSKKQIHTIFSINKNAFKNFRQYTLF